MAKTPIGTIATAGLDKLTKGDFLDPKKLVANKPAKALPKFTAKKRHPARGG